MSKSDSTVTLPKSMRHKRILDVAAENPDASLAELADGVPSATVDLVENILEEYGDPADTEPEPQPQESASPPTPDETPPDPDELSSSQRQTLQAIHENPEATQRELGDLLGVSPSTICTRVNAIPGFDWENRTTFTTTMFDTTNHDEAAMTSQNGAQTAETDLRDRIDTIEAQLNTENPEPSSAFDDPEFAYKILRACIDAENITEEEERRLFIELHK